MTDFDDTKPSEGKPRTHGKPEEVKDEANNDDIQKSDPKKEHLEDWRSGENSVID